MGHLEIRGRSLTGRIPGCNVRAISRGFILAQDFLNHALAGRGSGRARPALVMLSVASSAFSESELADWIRRYMKPV
jgi:hypothetical protein